MRSLKHSEAQNSQNHKAVRCSKSPLITADVLDLPTPDPGTADLGTADLGTADLGRLEGLRGRGGAEWGGLSILM